MAPTCVEAGQVHTGGVEVKQTEWGVAMDTGGGRLQVSPARSILSVSLTPTGGILIAAKNRPVN